MEEGEERGTFQEGGLKEGRKEERRIEDLSLRGKMYMAGVSDRK